MIRTSPDTHQLDAALLEAQRLLGAVPTDAKNTHFNNQYATVEAVLGVAKPVLSDVGVVLIQAPGVISNGSLELVTRLTHAASGQWLEATTSMPLARNDPQGAVAATTYGRRSVLVALLALPVTDDDGETAVGRGASPAPKPAARKPAKVAAEAPAGDALDDALARTKRPLTLSQKVAMNCEKPAYWKWIEEDFGDHISSPSECADWCRSRYRVGSRAELDKPGDAQVLALEDLEQFANWMRLG